ncbi:unnamed protein product [Nippostrongylus brasiliensis]|uniref:Phospholipid scramblase n=1 Tax=Nippostrongylus brasiliensis TaxID=27835 RepID=A0A158QYV4_NIPBR|nr:unnamed protein product [Nippostrongylus brasiliensis]
MVISKQPGEEDEDEKGDKPETSKDDKQSNLPQCLKVLNSLEGVVIEQRLELLEMHTKFEGSNKYDVHALGGMPVYSSEDGSRIGSITKLFAGVLQEYKTDADTYKLLFPTDLSLTAKMTIIAATILIDFIAFEDNEGKKKYGKAK